MQRGFRDWTMAGEWLHVSEYEDVVVTNLFCATRQHLIALAAACHFNKGPSYLGEPGLAKRGGQLEGGVDCVACDPTSVSETRHADGTGLGWLCRAQRSRQAIPSWELGLGTSLLSVSRRFRGQNTKNQGIGATACWLMHPKSTSPSLTLIRKQPKRVVWVVSALL